MSGSKPSLVDSSGWIEHLGGGPKAGQLEPFLRREESLVLPTIVIYEVMRKLEREGQDVAALQFLSIVHRTRVVPLEIHLAIAAAKIAVSTRLPMADAIIFATAQDSGAELITKDSHFQGLPSVTIV